MLEYNSGNGVVYVILATPPDMSDWVGTFSPTLKFVVKDCDPATGEPDSDEGYADEYVLEDLEMVVADHVHGVHRPNFLAAWDEVGEDFEMEDTYSLSSMTSLEEAVEKITQYMGLQPCERSDRVPPEKN